MRHTALLNEQETQWASDGRTVFIEGQNSFRLRRKSATLAGRPDLAVLDQRDATIIGGTAQVGETLTDRLQTR